MTAMIELEDPSPTPPKPRLPGSVVVRSLPDDALDAAAADFLIQAQNCVRTFGDFHLAVSMTGTEALLRRLMFDPALRELPWKRTHLWMVDEWDVPADDSRRLFPLLQELIVEPSDIPLDQVHAIPVSADGLKAVKGKAAKNKPEAPDVRYEARLREYLGWREKGHDRLDCVLLGGVSVTGPGTNEVVRANEIDERLVRTVPAKSLGTAVDLVTMTTRMLRGARLISVVALGSETRLMVEQAAGNTEKNYAATDAAREFPRSGLVPLLGELCWYLDADACPPMNAGPSAAQA